MDIKITKLTVNEACAVDAECTEYLDDRIYLHTLDKFREILEQAFEPYKVTVELDCDESIDNNWQEELEGK